MAISIINCNFDNLSDEKTLRFDTDYIKYQKNIVSSKYYTFSELFEIVKKVNNSCELPEEDFLYAEIGNVSKNGEVDPVPLNFNTRSLENENYYKKIEKGDIIICEVNDILLSKVRPNLKKFVYITDEYKHIYFTSAFLQLKAKKIPKILYYCLKTEFFDSIVAISRQGKGYPTLSENDLPYLRFNRQIIDRLLLSEKKILNKIEVIEDQISNINSKKRKDSEIINEIFAREFGFEYVYFEKLKKEWFYNATLFQFANNRDLRQSVKFHRKSGEFVLSQLKNITNAKIKDFLAEPIVLGTSISPTDYDEAGSYCYVSMADIKNWRFKSEDAKLVSEAYSKSNQNKTVANNDIILARSGEGTIGKVALIEDEDINGIFADFTMRIRLKDYNPLFAYYYFRSSYFQYLVEINKKGLGNNTNIFPSMIQEFPLIDIKLDEQQRIVDEIKLEMDKQEKIEKDIAILRREIDKIIQNTLKNIE